jgi:hypothetical protein
MLQSGVLDTDLIAVSATDDTIPSAKATKAYADSVVNSLSTSHINASTGVHGVGSGTVVSTTLGQTLTNKTIDGLTNTVSGTRGGTFTLDADANNMGVFSLVIEKGVQTSGDSGTPVTVSFPDDIIVEDEIILRDAPQSIYGKYISSSSLDACDIPALSSLGLFGTATITALDIDLTTVSANHDSLATAKAIKAYVDSIGVSTSQDVYSIAHLSITPDQVNASRDPANKGLLIWNKYTTANSQQEIYLTTNNIAGSNKIYIGDIYGSTSNGAPAARKQIEINTNNGDIVTYGVITSSAVYTKELAIENLRQTYLTPKYVVFTGGLDPDGWWNPDNGLAIGSIYPNYATYYFYAPYSGILEIKAACGQILAGCRIDLAMKAYTGSSNPPTSNAATKLQETLIRVADSGQSGGTVYRYINLTEGLFYSFHPYSTNTNGPFTLTLTYRRPVMSIPVYNFGDPTVATNWNNYSTLA